MPFYIVNENIVNMRTDAIVNAANRKLKRGGGVCGAIFKAAGKNLAKECRPQAPCPAGHAVITNAYQLPANYIIHAVGPKWRGGKKQEKEHLESAYRNALKLAYSHNCHSISFPLLSAGIYRYLKREALETAVAVIQDFLLQYEMDVYLAILDPKLFRFCREVLGV